MKVTRKCECGRVMTFAAALARDVFAMRQQLVTFANTHEGCQIRMHPDSVPHRCGSCGLLLLFGDRCPFHSGSLREPWTVELAAAYRVAVEQVAAGSAPSVSNPLEYKASDLARRWGGLAEPGAIRYQPSAIRTEEERVS